ncbi:MAG: site-specific integrase [Pseudomonadota bacterium]
MRATIFLAGHAKWWKAVLAEEPVARDFLLMALFTGMRKSEIARLRWEHVDLEGKTLVVPDTKSGDPLQLPLSEFLGGLLAERRESDPLGEWVFSGRGTGNHLVETKRMHHRVSEASGITLTFHDLRRTFITIAKSLDIPHYALKRLLNHRADSDVTGG